MVTAIHILKFIIKLLLFIIFLPVILLWLLIRYWLYKAALVRSLVQSGMPESFAKDLAKETRPGKMFRWC